MYYLSLHKGTIKGIEFNELILKTVAAWHDLLGINHDQLEAHSYYFKRIESSKLPMVIKGRWSTSQSLPLNIVINKDLEIKYI
jgi:hypothetical protein